MSYELATFIAVTVLAVISPGADFAMVTRNSLISSRRVGVITAIGISAGVLVHVGYAVMGVGLIVSQSIVLFNILKLVGAAYLLWLGFTMLRARPTTEQELAHKAQISDRDALKIGFLTNVLNPKTTLFVVSVYVQLIGPTTPLAAKLGYGLFMSGAHLLWFTLVALFFSTGVIRRRLLAVRHWIDRAFGAALTALGLSLAFSTAGNRN